MELRQLKYFKEACERQNFSEAARTLHISQSTLSQQIKQLEEELDVLLFDRIGKRIVPTEAGQASCLMLHELSTMLKTGNKLSVI